MEKQAVIAKLLDNYWHHYLANCRVHRDVSKMIPLLGTKFRLAVVSNFKIPDGAKRILAHFDLLRHFCFTVDSVRVGWRKPNPRIYREAVNLAGCEPNFAVGPDRERFQFIRSHQSF